MKTALWITGNLLAVVVALCVNAAHGTAAAMFSWCVIAMLADIRRNTDLISARGDQNE